MELLYSGSGSILYQEKEYRCDLYLNENQGGILFTIYIDKAMVSSADLPFEIDCLPGKLDNGFNFTFFNCFRTNTENKISEGRTVFTFQASFMLEGVGSSNPEGINLYKVQFGLADILEWGSFSGYIIGENYELSTGDAVEISIYADDQIAIRYLVLTSMLPVVHQDLLKDKIVLSQQGIIEIQSQKPETIGFFEVYYQRIKRLIEISMKKAVRLINVIGWSHSVFFVGGEKHIERPISILAAELNSTNQQNKNERKFRWEWITLPELLKNNSFSLYIEKYDKLEPIVELYLETFSPKGISTKRLFLNLVQSLETYHSRFITNDINEYKKRIEHEILKDKSKRSVSEYTSFLMAKSHKHITLESRLADLLLANFELAFDTGNIRSCDFPEVISNTRNYLIHYNERIKQDKRVLTDDEISIYNNTLLAMIEYYLLRELGFTDTSEIKKKLNARWGSVSTTLSIIKASKEKEH